MPIKGYSNRIFAFIFLVIFILVIIESRVFAWSSVDTVSGFATHQFFNRLAYSELSNHPAFKYAKFPVLMNIQKYSGMDIDESGLGPDAAGNSNYSDHWYNPANRQGNAPFVAENFHNTMLKGILRSGDNPQNSAMAEHLARVAAYGAHFMQDLTCPMHVSGMESYYLDMNTPGSPADNSPYAPSYTPSEWKTLVRRFNQYSNSHATENSNPINFFDPLYFDGFLKNILADYVDNFYIKTGTHFQYELQIEAKYHAIGYQDQKRWEACKNSGYIPANFDNGKSITEFAKNTASVTRRRIGTRQKPGPLWFKIEESLPRVNYSVYNTQWSTDIRVPYEDWWRAVQVTYAYWRSTFSALNVKKGHIRLTAAPEQKNLYTLSIRVTNLEPAKGNVKNVAVKCKIDGDIQFNGNLSLNKPIPENDKTGWVNFSTPLHITKKDMLSGSIWLEVTGDYPEEIPDSGIKHIKYNLKGISVITPSETTEKEISSDKKSDDREEKKKTPPPSDERDEDTSLPADKDDYTIKAIAMETVDEIRGDKEYERIKDIEAVVVIIRMRNYDSIIDGYNAINLLIEKGYVYHVAGVGYVAGEKYHNFMISGSGNMQDGSKGKSSDIPDFVKETSPDNSDTGHKGNVGHTDRNTGNSNISKPSFVQNTVSARKKDINTNNKTGNKTTPDKHSREQKLSGGYYVFSVDAGPNLVVGTRDQVEKRSKCSFLNGGMDCVTKVKAEVLAGPYKSLAEAQENGLCPLIAEKSWWKMTANCQKRYKLSNGKYYWGCEESVQDGFSNFCGDFAQ